MVTEGKEGDARGGDGVEEDVVAGVACGAFRGASGGEGGKGWDTPGDVEGAVGDAEQAGVLGSGEGHVG